MAVTLDDFVRMLRAVRTDVTAAELNSLQRAVRRVLLAAMLDRTASPSEISEELRAIVEKAGSADGETINAEALVGWSGLAQDPAGQRLRPESDVAGAVPPLEGS